MFGSPQATRSLRITKKVSHVEGCPLRPRTGQADVEMIGSPFSREAAGKPVGPGAPSGVTQLRKALALRSKRPPVLAVSYQTSCHSRRRAYPFQVSSCFVGTPCRAGNYPRAESEQPGGWRLGQTGPTGQRPKTLCDRSVGGSVRRRRDQIRAHFRLWRPIICSGSRLRTKLVDGGTYVESVHVLPSPIDCCTWDADFRRSNSNG
jgi:hypothetical protein